jgi:predicted nucleotidyltransferase
MRDTMPKLVTGETAPRLLTRIGAACGDAKMVPEQVLQEVTRRLAEQFKPTRIILFGSQARGTADERSDVDLLVICPVNGQRLELMLAMDRALKGLGIARDIVILTPEEFELDRHIPGTVARPAALEGRVLYDRVA